MSDDSKASEDQSKEKEKIPKGCLIGCLAFILLPIMFITCIVLTTDSGPGLCDRSWEYMTFNQNISREEYRDYLMMCPENVPAEFKGG